MKSGEDYSELKKTIAINIIDFNMFNGNDYHTEVAAMIKGTNEVFSDKLSIHFFELKKVNEKPRTKCEQWLQFINADSKEEFEMVEATSTPIIQKAVRVILDMSEDTKIREMVRMREKTLHDEASALKQAKDEGKIEERMKIVDKLRAKGYTEEEICSLLDLPYDQTDYPNETDEDEDEEFEP